MEIGRSESGDEGVGGVRSWCSLGSNNEAKAHALALRSDVDESFVSTI